MSEMHRLLKEYFGYSQFRTGQEEIISHLLSGKDVMGIMPTGAGKSVCYQIPALMSNGVAIVISPLISLMKDQVGALKNAGIPAAYINSSLSLTESRGIYRNALMGRYKLLYVAPERLENNDFLELASNIDITLIAIDEAHCVSQWGQDFRPSYLKIHSFIDSLPNRPPVGAFTATATKEVKEDIKNLLRLKDPFIMTTGFDRPNLYFGVIRTDKKEEELLKLIFERSERCGIVYCATRKKVEAVCSLLNANGIAATRYHAGLDEKERQENQEAFIMDKYKVMAATNAFGMGIDKSNVSYVIHYNMPKNLESYYQEAGRAGRDGSESDCIILYSPKDTILNRWMINKSEPNPELSREEQNAVKQRDIERLLIIDRYCNTSCCLRRFILSYFGDRAKHSCGNCSVCAKNYVLSDITIEAQKILSCIYRCRQLFGKSIIIDVLRGVKNSSYGLMGLDKLSTFGIMREVSARRIDEIIDSLISENYISLGSSGEVLKLTLKSADVLAGRTTVKMRVRKDSPKMALKRIVKSEKSAVGGTLMERLIRLRQEFAAKENVPPYYIFTDSALADMCKKLPKTSFEMMNVSGMGNMKLAKYGRAFLDVIVKYQEERAE